jgi:hypothetical protein
VGKSCILGKGKKGHKMGFFGALDRKTEISKAHDFWAKKFIFECLKNGQSCGQNGTAIGKIIFAVMGSVSQRATQPSQSSIFQSFDFCKFTIFHFISISFSISSCFSPFLSKFSLRASSRRAAAATMIVSCFCFVSFFFLHFLSLPGLRTSQGFKGGGM